MKKMIKIGLVSTMLLSINLFAANSSISKEEIKKINSELSKFNVRGITLKVINGEKTKGIEVLKAQVKIPGRGSQNVTIYKDGDVLFFGKAIDIKTGKEITLPKNMKIVKEGVAFKIGHGPKEIYLVTDPECPFCKRLEKQLPSDFKDKYTVNVIPMPLSFHRNAKQMYYYIFEGGNDKEKAKRMKDVMKGMDNNWKNYKPTPEEKKKYDKIIEKGYKAAKELGARGTPSVFDKNGNPINYMELLKK